MTRSVWQADQKAGRRDFLKKAERTGRSCFASKGKKKKKGTDYGQEGTQAGGE